MLYFKIKYKKMTAQDSVKKIIFLGMLVFLAVVIFGPAHTGMAMNDDGIMSNCPYLGITALCKMQPLEHVVAWQNMLVMLPVKTMALFASVLLLAFVALFVFLQQRRNGEVWRARPSQQKHRRRFIVGIKDTLQEQFSNGILHTKIF